MGAAAVASPPRPAPRAHGAQCRAPKQRCSPPAALAPRHQRRVADVHLGRAAAKCRQLASLPRPQLRSRCRSHHGAAPCETAPPVSASRSLPPRCWQRCPPPSGVACAQAGIAFTLQHAVNHSVPKADAQRSAERGQRRSRGSAAGGGTLGRLAHAGGCPAADRRDAGFAETQHNPRQEEGKDVRGVVGCTELWRRHRANKRLQAQQGGNAHCLATLAACLHLGVGSLRPSTHVISQRAQQHSTLPGSATAPLACSSRLVRCPRSGAVSSARS